MPFRFHVVTACALALLVVAGCANQSDKTVIKVACELPPEHPSPQALAFFKDRLTELSKGDGDTPQIEVQLFMSGQLGNTIQTVESTQNGSIQMCLVSTGPLAQFVPMMNALSMPFIFRSGEHQYAVVDGPVAGKLNEKLGAKQLVSLGYFDAGSRNVMTKQGPVHAPDDLDGLKIRVMPSKLMIDVLNAMGASATDMAQGEVYSALQTGLLDGWENNPPTVLSFKMYETGCKYYSWTRHLSIPDVMLMNKAFYEGLSEQQRQWVDTAARDTVEKQRELWQAGERQAIDKLKAAGMEFNDVNLDPFVARVEPIYKQYEDKYGQEFQALIEQIRAIQP